MKKYSSVKRNLKIYKSLALGITVVLHPLLMLTYSFILIGYMAPLAISPFNSDEGRRFLIGLIFMSTFFLPLLLLALYIMVKSNRWSKRSFLMEDSQERVVPFLFIGLYFVGLLYLISRTPQLNETILIFTACTTVSILIVSLISRFWKISAHAVGISATIVLLTGIQYKVPDAALFYPIILLYLLSGILMSARLYLNAHTPTQVAGGIILGVVIGTTGCLFL